jgi:isoamylase
MRRFLPGVVLLVLLVASPSCAPPDTAHLYRTQPFAPSYTAANVSALQYLGPTFTDKGVNFSVYSHAATRIDLLLFDTLTTDEPAQTLTLSRFGDVWNIYVEGVGLGQYYGFRAWGPNWLYDPSWYPGSIAGFQADVDAYGNRFNPNKLLMDPYSQTVSGDHNWSIASAGTGPDRTADTYEAAAKSIVVQSKYTWSASEAQWRANRQNPNWPGHRWQDAIIYETHPKGFTMSPASGVTHPGTFRGIAENASYLADLGITAVELMPVMLKPVDGGYWGYNTLLFFVPNFDFTVPDPDPASHVDEFRYMVDQLHQNGIEVILDIVYNHTGEGGLWRDMEQFNGDVAGGPIYEDLSPLDAKEQASLYSYRGLDNYSYYAVAPDATGELNQTFCSEDCGTNGCLCNDGVTYGCQGSCNTGVGQEMRDNNVPMQKLILDSLHYWSQEMHVDGFRFDLAPVLAEEDLQPLNNSLGSGQTNTMINTIINDPVLAQYNTRIIAEPWSVVGDWQSYFPSGPNPGTGWYEWNGNFRDYWRELLNYDGTYLPTGWSPPNPDWTLNTNEGAIAAGNALTGSSNIFEGNGRRPYHSVNFVTIHDGFTMYDLFSYDVKENLCGPLNEICCDDPTSPFCDPSSGDDNNRSRDYGEQNEDLKRQLMRDLFVAMMISEGTPMLLGGDEWMRTQLGNNNAYSDSADNSYNWYDWGTWQASDYRNRMHDFVRNVIQFRKEHAYAFVADDWGSAAPFTWEDENGNTPPNWNSRHLMMHFTDPSQGPPLLVMINMELGSVDYQLPPGNWVKLIDTQLYFDTESYFAANPSLNSFLSQNISLGSPTLVPTPDYNVPTKTIVVLQAQ